MKHLILYTVVCQLILSFACKNAGAQNYYHRVYNVQNGLAQSQVIALCVDKNGYLWIGTLGGGVNIYNGMGFSTISKEDGLAGDNVFTICEDIDGNKWIGTDKGISRISGKKIKNFTTGDGLPDNNIRKIYQDSNGKLWVGTDKGLAVFSGNKFEIEKVSDIISNSTIYSIFEDTGKNIWIGTKKSGAFKITKDKSVVQYSTDNGILNNCIWTINQDSSGNIILGSTKGINSITGDTILKYEIGSCLSTFSPRPGELWFSTYVGGVLSFSSFSGYPLVFNTTYDFKGYLIRCVITDRESNIWLGTENGLVQIPPSAFNNWKNGQKQANNNVFSISEGFLKDELWTGTWGGGTSNLKFRDKTQQFFYTYSTFRTDIKRADKEKGAARKNLIKKIVSKGVMGNSVFGIVKDGKNRLWFGTQVGLSIFNPTDSSFNHITNDTIDFKFGCTVNKKLTNNSFNFLTIDKSGRIWGATMGGVVVFSDTSVVMEGSALKQLSKTPVYHIYEDGKGTFWISSLDGLYIFDGQNLVHKNEKDGFTNSSVTAVTQDSFGCYWLATKEGVYCYDGKKFNLIDKTKGLKSNNVYLIITDKTGDYLFIGTNLGLDRLNLSRYHKDSYVELRHYGILEGFLGVECNRNACYRDSSGRIWFGTVDGITMYNPLKDSLNTAKPKSTLLKILYNFQDFDWTPYCDRIDTLTGLPVNLTLPYNKNHLTFEFSSNSLSIPEKVKFMFMMEGIDTTWSPPMSKNEADFPTLPPGKYTFKIKACNNDGFWEEEPLAYSFEITPPWYQTTWFIVTAIIVTIIMIIVFIKYREASLLRDKIRLEKTVKERTAEVVHQKEIVEQKNKDITDSINYARNIQIALLPTRIEVQKYFPDSFILFKPRDIVSGDFYWISHRNNRTFFAVADCTGHGVPGAFMSMLGIAFLDEIIGINDNFSSNEILNLLRENVILSLRQSEAVTLQGNIPQNSEREGTNQPAPNVKSMLSSSMSVKDGMDIALIIVNWDNREIEFSGANNPVYFISNNQLAEYKGDKMPIGVHIRQQPFNKQVIRFNANDSIYLLSDGYADQFGGKKGKKFMYKSLKELLVKINSLPMNEQETILNNNLMEWKGNYPQLDDIIMSGIRFG